MHSLPWFQTFLLSKSNGSWIYNYLFNQCLSPIMLWVWILLMANNYVIKFVSDLRQVGGFSLGTPVYSTNNTDSHDINEILLRVALNTITLTPYFIEQKHDRRIRYKFYNIEHHLFLLTIPASIPPMWDDIPTSVTSSSKYLLYIAIPVSLKAKNRYVALLNI